MSVCKDQRFHLAARTLQLGYSYLSSLPIVSLIQPRLSALSEKLNESCALSILDGTDAVCIARATARRLERDYMGVGTRLPAHATSAGKVLLGALAETRRSARSTPARSKLPAVTPFTITDPDGPAAADRAGPAGRLVLHQPGDRAGHRLARGADPGRGRDALFAQRQRAAQFRRRRRSSSDTCPISSAPQRRSPACSPPRPERRSSAGGPAARVPS